MPTIEEFREMFELDIATEMYIEQLTEGEFDQFAIAMLTQAIDMVEHGELKLDIQSKLGQELVKCLGMPPDDLEDHLLN